MQLRRAPSAIRLGLAVALSVIWLIAALVLTFSWGPFYDAAYSAETANGFLATWLGVGASVAELVDAKYVRDVEIELQTREREAQGAAGGNEHGAAGGAQVTSL